MRIRLRKQGVVGLIHRDARIFRADICPCVGFEKVPIARKLPELRSAKVEIFQICHQRDGQIVAAHGDIQSALDAGEFRRFAMGGVRQIFDLARQVLRKRRNARVHIIDRQRLCQHLLRVWSL